MDQTIRCTSASFRISSALMSRFSHGKNSRSVAFTNSTRCGRFMAHPVAQLSQDHQQQREILERQLSHSQSCHALLKRAPTYLFGERRNEVNMVSPYERDQLGCGQLLGSS